MHTSNRPFWLLWMRFMWQWEQSSLESVICPGTQKSSPPEPVPLSSPVTGTGWKPATQMTSRVLFQGLQFFIWKLSLQFVLNFLAFVAFAILAVLSNLYSLGNTNSPDSIIKVKNILKHWFHYFLLEVWAISSRGMLLLYWKCSLCLTKTSWSYSILLQWKRGRRMGLWAALTLWNSPFKMKANLSGFRTPALLTGQGLWRNSSWQQCCPTERALCVVFCVVLHEE